jgi:threonine/homoserine/homoserine lactone efflux protein
MDLFWNGVKLGLALSLLAGPILIALIQTSIEQGFRAGWMVGWGIWISDLLFISATYFGISWVAQLTEWDGLEKMLGVGGGLILIAFGVGSYLTKPPQMEGFEKKAIRHSSYLALWTKGFVINTFNPFTIFFWLGISGLLFTERNLLPVEARQFYTGLMCTVVVTDSLKIGLAKAIRRWLKPKYILWLRRIAGGALMVFGLVLLARAFKFIQF